MDISKIGIKRFVPTFNENAKASEPFVVLHKTLRRKWTIEAMDISSQASECRQRAADEALPMAERRKAAEESVKLNETFTVGFCADHIVGVEGLENDGEPVDAAGFVEVLGEIPDLAEEIMTHIMQSGRLSEDESGN